MSWMDKRKEHGTGNQGFEPMPVGDYVLEVVKATMGETKRKDGKILTLDMTVVSDDFNGRHVFCRLNVENPNAVAERIALEQLNQLIECAGLDDPQSEEELVGAVVGAHLKIRNDEGYEPDNEVSYFKKPEECKLGTKAPGKPAAKPSVEKKEETSKRKPWEKGKEETSKRKPWEKG